jgi:hypothetical protein
VRKILYVIDVRQVGDRCNVGRPPSIEHDLAACVGSGKSDKSPTFRSGSQQTKYASYPDGRAGPTAGLIRLLIDFALAQLDYQAPLSANNPFFAATKAIARGKYWSEPQYRTMVRSSLECAGFARNGAVSKR